MGGQPEFSFYPKYKFLGLNHLVLVDDMILYGKLDTHCLMDMISALHEFA